MFPKENHEYCLTCGGRKGIHFNEPRDYVYLLSSKPKFE